MDNSEWRSKARIVAYVDLVLSSVSMIVVILWVLIAAFESEEIAAADKAQGTDLLWIVWIFLIILFIAGFGDLWCAYMLLKATKSGADPEFALEKAKYWRNINIICIILTIVVGIPTQVYIPSTFHVLFRVSLIFIVSKFVGELNENAKFASVPPA